MDAFNPPSGSDQQANHSDIKLEEKTQINDNQGNVNQETEINTDETKICNGNISNDSIDPNK